MGNCQSFKSPETQPQSRFTSLVQARSTSFDLASGKGPVPQVEPDGYFPIKLAHNSQKLSCLVMEKICGENLAEFLAKNQYVCQELALDWLQQMLYILHKIHKYHLVHRDIKPSNLMLAADGKLRLIDFGAATEAGIDTTPIGSAGYCAPEQNCR